MFLLYSSIERKVPFDDTEFDELNQLNLPPARKETHVSIPCTAVCLYLLMYGSIGLISHCACLPSLVCPTSPKNFLDLVASFLVWHDFPVETESLIRCCAVCRYKSWKAREIQLECSNSCSLLCLSIMKYVNWSVCRYLFSLCVIDSNVCPCDVWA